MTWSLHEHGELEWPEVQGLIAGASCAWADYAGFHVGPCPDSAPPYSHLWAWDADGSRLVRVRVDGSRGVVGVLSRTAATSVGDGSQVRTVEVQERPGVPWGNDKRVAAVPEVREITIFEVQGLPELVGQAPAHAVIAPVTFVRVLPAQA